MIANQDVNTVVDLETDMQTVQKRDKGKNQKDTGEASQPSEEGKENKVLIQQGETEPEEHLAKTLIHRKTATENHQLNLTRTVKKITETEIKYLEW